MGFMEETRHRIETKNEMGGPQWAITSNLRVSRMTMSETSKITKMGRPREGALKIEYTVKKRKGKEKRKQEGGT